MKTLDLTIVDAAGLHPLKFPVRRVVNAGYTGRNQESVHAHIAELAHEGVPPPRAVPIALPFLTANLTTANEIEVIGDRTSGEVEYVLILHDGDIFVGVGSDHTDRALERQSILKSKQMCANVLSREVRRYQDVRNYWDELVLRSWTQPAAGEPEVLYQESTLSSMLPPETLIDLVRSRLLDQQDEGLVIFSGTISTCGGTPIHGESFRGELFDPRTGRRLSFAYAVRRLDYLRDVEE